MLQGVSIGAFGVLALLLFAAFFYQRRLLNVPITETRTAMTQRRRHEDMVEPQPDPSPPKFVLMDESGWLQQLKLTPSVPGVFMLSPDTTSAEASPPKTFSVPAPSAPFGDTSNAPQPHRSDMPERPSSSLIPRLPLPTSSASGVTPSSSRHRSPSPERAQSPPRPKSALRMSSPLRIPSRAVSPLSRTLSPLRPLSPLTSPHTGAGAQSASASWHAHVSRTLDYDGTTGSNPRALHESPRVPQQPASSVSPRYAAAMTQSNADSAPQLSPVAASPTDYLQASSPHGAWAPAMAEPTISPSLSPPNPQAQHQLSPSAGQANTRTPMSYTPTFTNGNVPTYSQQRAMNGIFTSPVVASASPPMAVGLAVPTLSNQQWGGAGGDPLNESARSQRVSHGTPQRLMRENLNAPSPARTRLPPPTQAHTHWGVMTPISPRITQAEDTHSPARVFGSSKALGSRSALARAQQAQARTFQDQARDTFDHEQRSQAAATRGYAEPQQLRGREADRGVVYSPQQRRLPDMHAVAVAGNFRTSLRGAADGLGGRRHEVDESRDSADTLSLNDVSFEMNQGQHSAFSPYGARQDMTQRNDMHASLNSSLQRFSTVLEAEMMRSRFLEGSNASVQDSRDAYSQEYEDHYADGNRARSPRA
jgi:hypothetical protein